MEYHHQDWEPVVWTKRSSPIPSKSVKYDNDPMKKLEKSTDIEEIKKVDPETSKKIIQARIKKKMTRKQLAQYLSISETFIIDCETCQKRPNEKIMNKIMNFVNKS